MKKVFFFCKESLGELREHDSRVPILPVCKDSLPERKKKENHTEEGEVEIATDVF